MTDDRTLERAARSWLEEGPTRAPDRPVAAALARIQTTRQERGPWIPWRLPSMNPLVRVAAAAALVVVAVGGAFYLFGGRSGGIGGPPTPTPTIVPSPSPTVTPSPTVVAIQTPWTGACRLITGDEAETTAGVVGLGAIPYETALGDATVCLYSDGGGTPVLRLTWTPTGGIAAFDIAQAEPGVETIADLGDAAVFNPATDTLHVRQGDAHLAVFVGNQEGNRTEEDRRARAESIAALALPFM